MERSHTTVESPDILRWELIDVVSVADMKRLYAEQAAFCRGKPGIYIIVDLQRMKHVEAAARHEGARAPLVDGKPMIVHAIAIVGGSFHFRLLGKMMNKAASLLNHVPETPVEFFDLFEDAQQWIAKRKAAEASS